MVDRFTSAPIELPESAGEFARADLIFLGVDHSGASFEARLFLDAPEADRAWPRDHPDCCGSFFIFGHGGCFGDVGHCDVPPERDAFDLRPPHPLLPAIRVVTVTEAIRRRLAAGAAAVTVTVVAHAADGRPDDVLAFDTVRLAFYAEAEGPRPPSA
jgi:hypothetical protein